MKRNLVWIVACLLGCPAVAQNDPVLMRINGKDILRSEFEYFLQKKQPVNGQKSGKLSAYVDLFIDNKLKVAAAGNAGMDTTLTFRNEMARYRQQLLKQYLTNESADNIGMRRIYEKMKSEPHSGKIQVMHIFKYLPQNVMPHQLQEVQNKMDSIYAALKKDTNADFSKFVQKYSDEKDAFWVEWLRTPVEFEDAVFSLGTGEFSKPFFTPRGLHIVKVIAREEMPSYEEIRKELESRLAERLEVGDGGVERVGKLKEKYRYTPDKLAIEELMTKGSTTKNLFSLENRMYTGEEFRRFAESHPLGIKRQFEAFVTKSVLDYGNRQIEQGDMEFRQQMGRYRDEVLLTAITEKEMRRQDKIDTIGLKSYFKAHQSDYNWESPRFQGAVLHATTKRIGKQARKLLKKLPESEWKEAVRLTFNASSSPEVVLIEQGIFAEGDNKFIDKIVFKKGNYEPVKSNPFTIIVGDKRKGPKSYNEVLEPLLKDYRRYLDALWTERLRASGKVEINQEVLKTVNNH